jgi:hypothetical protein
MSLSITITVSGLRQFNGRLTKFVNGGLQQRRDEALVEAAALLKDRLEIVTPRGAGRGGHLAQAYIITGPEVEGASATMSIENTKSVMSKSGKVWSLLELLVHGTPPHNIPGAFGFPPPFGTVGKYDGMFHPGTRPNDFVQRAIAETDFSAILRSAAARMIVDMSEG